MRYLKFLWKPYRTPFFWFEVFELLRKLAQTAVRLLCMCVGGLIFLQVVVFVAQGTNGQVVFQLVVTALSVIVINSLLPYADRANNGRCLVFAPLAHSFCDSARPGGPVLPVWDLLDVSCFFESTLCLTL